MCVYIIGSCTRVTDYFIQPKWPKKVYPLRFEDRNVPNICLQFRYTHQTQNFVTLFSQSNLVLLFILKLKNNASYLDNKMINILNIIFN